MCLTEKEAKEYREYLEKLASVKSAEMFSNGGRDHAVVLYSVLLENACLHARFFCESGMSAIWTHPTFKSALVNALRKADFKVDVLTRNQAEPDFEWLPAELKNKVRVKTILRKNLASLILISKPILAIFQFLIMKCSGLSMMLSILKPTDHSMSR